MAIGPEFKSYIEDLFQAFGPVPVRRLFGGAGIFVQDVDRDLMIGLVLDERLYLKVGDANRDDFEAEGMSAFSYPAKDGTRSLRSFYEAPEFLYDDPDRLAGWARKSYDAALTAPRRGKKKT